MIVGIFFISSFLFYCLLTNHSFQTNPNSITNCFKLFLSLLQFYNYIAPASLFWFLKQLLILVPTTIKNDICKPCFIRLTVTAVAFYRRMNLKKRCKVSQCLVTMWISSLINMILITITDYLSLNCQICCTTIQQVSIQSDAGAM